MVWLTIEDENGVTVGRVDNLIDFSTKEELNRAGSLSFSVSAENPAAPLLVEDRIVFAYSILDNTVTEIGAGVLTTVEPNTTSRLIEVRAKGLLYELGRRSLRDLAVHGGSNSADLFDFTKIIFDNAELVRGAFGYPSITWTTDKFLILVSDEPFAAIKFTFNVTQSTTANINMGLSTGNITYDYTVVFTDGTSATGATMGQDGSIIWGANFAYRDWGINTQDGDSGYKVILWPSADLGDIEFLNVRAIRYAPNDVDDVEQIATYRSTTSLPAWSVTGHDATTDGTFQLFDYEDSVLRGLTDTAALRGERFRRGTGRTVHWLRRDEAASGVSAVAAPDTLAVHSYDHLAEIISLHITQDSNERVTRLYPTGGQLSDGRPLTIADADTFPTGFTVDTANRYVEITGASSIIEKGVRFDDIKTAVGISTATAANALVAAAASYLEDRDEVQVYYDLELIHIAHRLRCGDTLHVIYRDSSINVIIDETFLMLSVEWRLMGSVLLAHVRCGSAARHPDDDAAFILDRLTPRVSQRVFN